MLCQTSGAYKKYHERICNCLKGERQERYKKREEGQKERGKDR
jgi:hypothetical protein